ncbi:MAG: Hsp70 family protein [Candidatus Hodgkinia cicadicola]
MQPCKTTLINVRISDTDICGIVLVGGMTRIPKVQNTVEQPFKRERVASKRNSRWSCTDWSGSSSWSSSKRWERCFAIRCNALSLGIETLGRVFTWLIEGNTTIPTKRTQIVSTTEDGQSADTIKIFSRRTS